MDVEDWDEEEYTEIDWENPFDEIRSSEINTIKLKMSTNGKKIRRIDDKGEEYTQYRFDGVRMDISKPSEVAYITSSKRLIEEISSLAPIKDKILLIEKTGSGFQTKYKVTEVKK